MIGQLQVTELSEGLLDVLRKRGDWTTRNQIAEAIGRPNGRLSPYDIELLNKMAAAGTIEAEKRVQAGIYRKEWIYRIKG